MRNRPRFGTFRPREQALPAHRQAELDRHNNRWTVRFGRRDESLRLLRAALPLLDAYVDPSPVELVTPGQIKRFGRQDPTNVDVYRGWPLNDSGKPFVVTENEYFGIAEFATGRSAYALTDYHRLAEAEVRNFGLEPGTTRDKDSGEVPRVLIDRPDAVRSSLQLLLDEAGITLPPV